MESPVRTRFSRLVRWPSIISASGENGEVQIEVRDVLFLWLVSFRGAEIQVHTYSFLFWVVLGYVGLGSNDGCFLAFLVWYESLGLDNGGGGSFLLVGSLSLGWLGLD